MYMPQAPTNLLLIYYIIKGLFQGPGSNARRVILLEIITFLFSG